MTADIPEPAGSSSWIPDVWFMMTGRIAPSLCCSNPGPPYLLFREALREVGSQGGDLDRAIGILGEILSSCPTEWLVFHQASQLLNIVGWRRRYHRDWFSPLATGKKLQAGRCGPYIAHALALMQAGSDEEVLHLTGRIITDSEPFSDDLRIARLIRASVLICTGEIEEGERELNEIPAVQNPEKR